MKYYVFEGRNVGTPGRPKLVQQVVYSTNDLLDAALYEDNLRKTYKDTTVVNCWTRSEEELEKEKLAKEFYNSLTEEQKHEYVEVDGRKYIKAIYEKNHK